MITFTTPKHHWNYYLAIAQDLEKVARYIEFAQDNLGVYSIELAHILLSASSEVDVIMKQWCALIAPGQKAENIIHYQSIVHPAVPDFCNEEITIGRYGLLFKPWENWVAATSPDWWTSHNEVKHTRNQHFRKANLQNTVNAVGALLLTVVHFYKCAFSKEVGLELHFKEATEQLQPESLFITLNDDYYYSSLMG